VVYAKKPFAGPKAVLAYLSRYTHRVAIANSRLLSLKDKKVTFKYKDYRKKGKKQQRTMPLDVDEFIRRFLIHILPSGFHRIRHIGLFANARRRDNLARIRELLGQAEVEKPIEPVTTQKPNGIENKEQDNTTKVTYRCHVCGEVMNIIDTFIAQIHPRAPPIIMRPA